MIVRCSAGQSAAPRVDRRQTMMDRMRAQQESFAHANADELLEDEDENACIFCGITHTPQGEAAVPVAHAGGIACTACIHRDCLLQWQRVRNRKGIRVLNCPQCRERVAHVRQPTRHKASLCATPLPGGRYCMMHLGHLGPCAV